MEEEEEDGEDADEAQQQQQFDTQCALCDDGGNLLACDGPCMRSFHTGFNAECNLLGLPSDLAELLATTSDTFRCPNCLAGVQQCFICKKEGEENKDVFKCIHASCGRHYHPKCAQVDPGSPFACKLHTCKKCGQPAERGSKAGELVPCRRCPQAWHRRCLPPDLPLNREVQDGARVWLADYDEQQEAWLDGVETSLLYCKRHPMDPDTGQAKFVRRLRKAAERGQAKGQVHEVPYLLIRGDLRRAFLRHYAGQYRHLASSRQLLAEEAESAKRRRAAEAAAEEASSEEDVPLATKRRRLIKAGEAKKSVLAGKGPAEAGEQPESSGVTEDARVAGFEDYGEVQQMVPAVDRAPAARRSAAVDMERLEDALERLVHLPSRQRRADRRKRLLQAAEDDQRLTKDSLHMATRRPEPYRHPMKKTIDESRLQALERSVGCTAGQLGYAVEEFRNRRLSEAELMQVLDSGTVRAALTHYDDLLMVLAPYLHGERYSSYGRHFTSHKLLHDVAERLREHLRSGDQVVDFSCGENYFLPHLKQLCLRDNMPISGRAYDIILAKDSTDFVLKSWFDARPDTEGLAPPHQLVIGLNPPFGKNNSLADKFVRKAANFWPRLMVLIVPPHTIIPPGYRVVLESSKMCGGEEFYVPGSSHKSWNKEWPVLRILERQAFFSPVVDPACPAPAPTVEVSEHEARRLQVPHQELIDCTAAVHMHHQPFGAGGYLQGFAAGYGAPAGPDVYGAYGYAPHHAQMLPQQPYAPMYGQQMSGMEWPQPQQAAYHGLPAVQPPMMPPQNMQGRGRQHYGGRGPGRQHGGRGRGRGRR
ncbi:hypothetical protein COHA_003520 [Chlorella ohadii]|uniref:Zinc finger PHD-type domain-containing protein n=1 Tax=Chlorella ohadii TaxID=2649997 RepID=A0AAD5DUR9_9CHLO|nr:hypothetical protein COHA_003520 [Chlorella ohadii]